MKSWPAFVVLLLLLGACAKSRINEHVVDNSYEGEPRRMFVAGAIDPQWNLQASKVFHDAISGELSRCGVTVDVYESPSKLTLNLDRNVAAQLAAFQPDAILAMHQTERVSRRGDVISSSYVVTLFVPRLQREVWKAELTLFSGFFASDREAAAAELGRQIVGEMARDKILRSCPPPNSSARGSASGP